MDSPFCFPCKLKTHWFLKQELINTDFSKIPFAHFPPGVAKGVQIEEWQIPQKLQIDYLIFIIQ